MPEPLVPRMSAADEAELDTALEDPRFQLYADTFMDMEFRGEGLSDAVLELESTSYLLQVRILLHNAAVEMLEPGEHYVSAYRIARERAANWLQQQVLAAALKSRPAAKAG
jgi:hypothetical protein